MPDPAATVYLLAYTPPLKLSGCCAKPHNAVHPVTIEEVQQWALEHGYKLIPQV